jgi:outer membrane protein assembly factor BamB
MDREVVRRTWTIASATAALLVAGPLAAPARPDPLPPLPAIGNPFGTPAPSPGPPSPGSPVPGPGADVVAYQGNPARSGATADESVFGPLAKLWSIRYPGPVDQPLIVGGRVIVNVANGESGYGSSVLALNPTTGRELWRQATPGTYFSAPIAADQGRVVSVNFNGVVRAFDAADGSPAWTTALSGSTGNGAPAAAGGLFFVLLSSGTARATLSALSIADGSVRWSRDLALSDVFRAMPALDDRRIFVADSCGGSDAFSQSSGQVLWSRHGSSSCSAGRAAVADGRVLAPMGRTYDAASGADGPIVGPDVPDAAGAGLALYGGMPVRAIDLASATGRWTFTDPGGTMFAAEQLPPIIAGHTVFATGQSRRLFGLDRATGAVRSVSVLPDGSHDSVGGITPGMAAGQGVLVATQGLTLTAFTAVLRPSTAGVDVAADAFEVLSGQRFHVVGGVGPALRGQRRAIEVQSGTGSRRGYRSAGQGRTFADGTALFTVRIGRNGRVRVRLPGGPASVGLPMVAYPRTHFGRLRRVDARHAAITIGLRGDNAFRPGGQAAFLYLGQGRRYRRLGSGRVRNAGHGRATVRIVFTIPRHPRAKDVLTYCMRGLVRLGYGRNDRFQRGCGRPLIRP